MIHPLPLILLLLAIFFQLCDSFTQTGYYILDLETETLTEEITTDWSLSSAISPTDKIYTTSAWNLMPSRTILGGPNILGPSASSAANEFFSRSYSGISPHTYVSFTLILWYFDDWSSRNNLPGVKFSIDSSIISGLSLSYSNDFKSQEGGDNTEKDSGFDHVMAGIAHIEFYEKSLSHLPSLRVKIIGLLQDTIDNRRFGFREISFTFSNYSGPLPPICHRSQEIDLYSPATGLKFGQCACPLGQALSGTACAACAPGCKKCFGPFGSQCYQCNSGLLWTGAQCCDPKCSICSGITSDECSECNLPYFNYKNGTCKDTCPSPFNGSAIIGNQKFCNKPCKTGEYYYSFNQTCLTKCPSPLSNYTDPSDFILYCYNPCDPTDEFLFTNGTCLDNCPSLLSSRQESGVQYCFNPCPSPSNYFIFTANGTCLTNCPFPLSYYEDPGVKYCYNPCPDPSNQYLFQNASCFNTCPAPLANRTEPGVKYCFNPCTLSNYLYPNGSCSSQCISPLVHKTEPDVTYCYNPCSLNNMYLYANESCYADCPFPLASRTDHIAKYCFVPCEDPTTEYLYANQSCFLTCPLPLESHDESGVKYCLNPCLQNQFLFPNQSCFDTCPPPLISRSEPGVKYCFNPCTSPTTQYLYPNGTCSTQCVSPLASRTEPDVMYCFNPCFTTSLFLYTNQSCFTDCPSPLVWRAEPGVKYCFNPCQDPSNDFLFSNQSCYSTCPYPLKSRNEPGVKYCFNPCSAASFLFWNQTCSPTCLLPLLPKIEPGVNYCINPCTSPTTELLYQNGSCLTTCPSPLLQRSEPGVKYCYNPCQYPGRYLYTNGSCMNNCPLPLISRNEPDVDYCFPPCTAPDIYWYINATCLPDCESPYLKITYSGVQQCLSPCKNESDYFYKNENKCQETCDPPFEHYLADKIKVCFSEFNADFATVSKARSIAESIESQTKAASALGKTIGMLKSSNPSVALLSSFSSMFNYIRYIDIKYPSKVEVFFLVSNATPITLNFDLKIPESLQEKMQDYPLPKTFEKYPYVHSDFLYNTWDLLWTLFISFMIIATLEIIWKIYKNSLQMRAFIQKILHAIKWNIPLMLLYSTGGDIFFFVPLHLRAMHLNSFVSGISLIFSLILMGVILTLLYLSIKPVLILKKARQQTPRSHDYQEYKFKQDWKNYEFLYIFFEEKSLLKLSYMSFFLLRSLIFGLTISCFFEFPRLQVSIILICNLFMTAHVLIFRPFKKTLNLLHAIINEILLLILSISILILAVMDHHNINNQTVRTNLGETILFTLQAFHATAVAFLGIYILQGTHFLYKKYKYLNAKGTHESILEAMIFEDFDPKKLESQEALAPFDTLPQQFPEKRKKIFKPQRKDSRKDLQKDHAPIFAEENPDYQTILNPPNAANFTRSELNSSTLSLFKRESHSNQLNNTFELSQYFEPESENNLQVISFDNQSQKLSTIRPATPLDSLNKSIEIRKTPNSQSESRFIIDSQDLKGKSQFIDLKFSFESDQMIKKRESLFKGFSRFRGNNRASNMKVQSSIEKTLQEEDADIINFVLPEDGGETAVISNNAMIKDFRNFKDKQKRLNERTLKEQKKNWYDGLRKAKIKIRKDKNKEESS